MVRAHIQPIHVICSLRELRQEVKHSQQQQKFYQVITWNKGIVCGESFYVLIILIIHVPLGYIDFEDITRPILYGARGLKVSCHSLIGVWCRLKEAQYNLTHSEIKYIITLI
jgi:hypothetical protein